MKSAKRSNQTKNHWHLSRNSLYVVCCVIIIMLLLLFFLFGGKKEQHKGLVRLQQSGKSFDSLHHSNNDPYPACGAIMRTSPFLVAPTGLSHLENDTTERKRHRPVSTTAAADQAKGGHKKNESVRKATAKSGVDLFKTAETFTLLMETEDGTIEISQGYPSPSGKD
jgi:hypothetical protein